jgi:hypothetical protein
MVGKVRDPDGADTLMCTVGEMMPADMKADVAAMQKALQAWVGGAPLRSSGEFAEFAYREAGGRRTPLPPSEDPLADGAPRPRPDVAGVTLHAEGAFPTITYQRSL